MYSALSADLSPSPDIRRIRARYLSVSLSFYLALDCEAGPSGPGWAQLRNADTVFLVEHRGIGARPGSVALDLSAENLLYLCRRLWSAGIDTTPIGYPADAPDGRITTRDPDLQPVSISQAANCGRRSLAVTR